MENKGHKGTAVKPKALAQWLADEIRAKILSGEYCLGEILDSERKLCREHKVSRTTVGATLDMLEEDGLIRRYPRQGIVVTGKDEVGKKEVAQKTQVNRIMFIRNAMNISNHVAEGIKRFCRENQLDFLLLDAGKSNKNFQGYIEHPPEGVNGVIFTPFWMPEYLNAMRSLIKKGIHVFCAGRVLDGVDVSSVTVDNYTGGYQATRHLIEHWNRPVYYIGYRQYPSSGEERFEGWRVAMEDHGFYNSEAEYLLKLTHREEENFAPPGRKYEQYGYEITSELFSRTTSTPPDGWSLFTVNDATAMGIYRAAEEKGLKIGKDVAVVGFGDLPLAQGTRPGLSTVYMAPVSLGYHAAKLLCEQMKNPKARPIHQVLPVELIVRESSIAASELAMSGNANKKSKSRVRCT